MKNRQPSGELALQGPPAFDFAAVVRRASPALLVIGIWLICHPFKGIIHDSRLYVTQLLNALEPEVFSRDLYFTFGSQDDLSLFSSLFAPLIDLLGPSPTAIFMVAVGQALWLSGAWALALRLGSNRTAVTVGLVLVAAMSPFYGGWQLISYGEGFFTPRLIAEGISLWLLWALVSRRFALAAALALVAALLHPLVAMATLVVVFWYLVLQDRRWIALAGAGVAAAFLLACLDIAPFGAFLRTMDAEWLAVVEQRNIFVFPALWRLGDWAWLGLVASTPLAAAALLDGWRLRLMVAGTLAGLSGVAVAHLGADMLNNVLLTQLQVWRTLWLMHVLAYLAAGILLVQLWRLKTDGLAVIALIVLSWLVTQLLFPVAGLMLGITAYAIAVLRLLGRLQPLPFVVRAGAVILSGLFIAFLVVCRAVYFLKRGALIPGDPSFWEIYGNITVIEVAAAAVFVLGLWRLKSDTLRRGLPLILLVVVVAGVASWDRRSRVTQEMTAATPYPPFDAALPRDAQIFWEGDVRGAWLLMRRVSYFSMAQGSGLLFRRLTALEFAERARVIEPLMGRDMLSHIDKSDEVPPPLPALDRGILADTCRKDTMLDAMVLSRAVPGAYAASWRLPSPVYDERWIMKSKDHPPIYQLYLYRCADLLGAP